MFEESLFYDNISVLSADCVAHNSPYFSYSYCHDQSIHEDVLIGFQEDLISFDQHYVYLGLHLRPFIY